MTRRPRDRQRSRVYAAEIINDGTAGLLIVAFMKHKVEHDALYIVDRIYREFTGRQMPEMRKKQAPLAGEALKDVTEHDDGTSQRPMHE